uniref:UPAR/Ly6 domain-containing protein n=1 Tax=Varanus komodoensis TaxID=61221 RepID=A0A8D2JIH4_VARKO
MSSSHFILALFSHSGSVLKRLKYDAGLCTHKLTCQANEDRCMVVYLGGHSGRNISACLDSFKIRCCTKDLCNSSSVTTGSKTILCIGYLLSNPDALFLT